MNTGRNKETKMNFKKAHLPCGHFLTLSSEWAFFFMGRRTSSARVRLAREVGCTARNAICMNRAQETWWRP